jgi:hypothetical protein
MICRLTTCLNRPELVKMWLHSCRTGPILRRAKQWWNWELETLQETEAGKLVAEVLGKDLSSDSDYELDHEDVLEQVAATTWKVDSFVSLLQMAINAAPFHEVSPWSSDAIFKTRRLMRRQETGGRKKSITSLPKHKLQWQAQSTSVAQYFIPTG